MAVMQYQTRDGLADYGFSIEFYPVVGWRIYVIFDPFPKYEDGMDLPYQSVDDDGRRYVDWVPKLENLSDAKTVASLWAELTQRYHRSRQLHTTQLDLIQRCLSSSGQKQIARRDGLNHADNPIGLDEVGAGHVHLGPPISHSLKN